MSLRVLLADESSTIKKVMQLALQDFAVDVKSVPNGLDVADVAKSFKPDIVFTDILLAKKNGYEVCAEFKKDSNLSQVPFVLMWSGFMSLDEKKLVGCEPNARLEKPFDAETLRGLVKDWVPKLKENVISQYLTFPSLPEFQESPKSMQPILAPEPMGEEIAPTYKNDLLEDSLEEPEEFMQVPLPGPSSPNAKSPLREPFKETKEDWAQQSLKQFKLPVNEEDLSLAYEMSGEGLESQPLTYSEPKISNENPVLQTRNTPLSPSISHERVEQIMREEIRKALESIAWKVLPDMAEKIVREEIQKLLKDAERL